MLVYMFHAIGELHEDDWADPHYSFSVEKFKAFLADVKTVVSLKLAIEHNIKEAVVVTFDDGHISNYNAAKYMYENQYGTADFFINPDLVGNQYYMNWQQIRELSSWGMSIQSHGLDHQYLSDCDDQELIRQLKESKRLIEKNINETVSILAPPGGRFDRRSSKLAFKLGYQCIANSIPGRVSNISCYHLPRLAVLKHYSVQDLISVQQLFSLLMIKLKLKYAILKVVKTLLGNHYYDKVRFRLVGDK